MAKQKLTRSINMGFRVTEEEQAMIYKRMGKTKMTSLRAYLLKMAIDGRVIQIDLTSTNENTRLLRNATNSLNQIAKRVNTTGDFYPADMTEIMARQDEIWEQNERILKALTKLLGAV